MGLMDTGNQESRHAADACPPASLIEQLAPTVSETQITALRAATAAATDGVDVAVRVSKDVAEKIVRLLELENRRGALVIGARSEFTPTEAAAVLGVSRQTVVRRIAAGELAAQKVGSHWRIQAEALVAYADQDAEERHEAMNRFLALSNDIEGRNATPVAEHVDVKAFAGEAKVRRAQERLLRIEDMKAAAALSDAGMSQREIATTLATTQPRIQGMLKAVEGRGRIVWPEEIILRAAVSRSSRTKLIDALSQLEYTFGEHAPEPFDGAVRGTWDEVAAAYVSGLLSKEEYERVRAAVRPPAV